jgi:hypothetical protein
VTARASGSAAAEHDPLARLFDDLQVAWKTFADGISKPRQPPTVILDSDQLALLASAIVARLLPLPESEPPFASPVLIPQPTPRVAAPKARAPPAEATPNGRRKAPATPARPVALRPAQAAQMLSVSKRTVWNYVRDGRLEVIKPNAGVTPVLVSSIHRMLGEGLSR